MIVKALVTSVQAVEDNTKAAVFLVGDGITCSLHVTIPESPRVGDEFEIKLTKKPSLGVRIETTHFKPE